MQKITERNLIILLIVIDSREGVFPRSLSADPLLIIFNFCLDALFNFINF